MLATFFNPAFQESEGCYVLSQRQFPNGEFPSYNFPKVRLCPLRSRRLTWGPSPAARTGFRPSATARTDLRSCRSGNCILGKMPLGKNHLGKYLTSCEVYIDYRHIMTNPCIHLCSPTHGIWEMTCKKCIY